MRPTAAATLVRSPSSSSDHLLDRSPSLPPVIISYHGGCGPLLSFADDIVARGGPTEDTLDELKKGKHRLAFEFTVENLAFVMGLAERDGSPGGDWKQEVALQDWGPRYDLLETIVSSVDRLSVSLLRCRALTAALVVARDQTRVILPVPGNGGLPQEQQPLLTDFLVSRRLSCALALRSVLTPLSSVIARCRSSSFSSTART